MPIGKSRTSTGPELFVKKKPREVDPKETREEIVVIRGEQKKAVVNQPVNPYIAGASLRSRQGFFGRQDILNWVASELRNPTTNVLVLFGRRRIGKTSILLQLERHLPRNAFLPVYFDLQDQASRPLGHVLADLADAVAERIGMEPPDSADFDNEGLFFRRKFLPRLYQVLGKTRRPVFLLDEFDVLEQVAKTERSDTTAAKAFYRFLRRTIAEDIRPAFVVVVGKQAEELSRDFITTFRASLAREIRMLDWESAELLIRQAESNGTLCFTDRAVRRILELTGCYPHLIQLLCQRVWEQAYANDNGNGISRSPTIDIPEVEFAAVDSLETGSQALSWLWDDLGLPEQIYISALAEIAEEGEFVSEDRVIQAIISSADWLHTREVELAPRGLVKKRVLEETRQGHRFAVELFRRWVSQYRPLQEIKDKIDHSELVAGCV